MSGEQQETQPSDTLDAAQLDTLVEPWKFLELTEFVEHIGDEIQEAGSEWRKLKRIRRQYLDPEFIATISAADAQEFGIDPAVNRQEHREFTVTAERFVTNIFRESMVQAQLSVTLKMFGDEHQKEQGLKIFDAEKEEIEALRESEESTPLNEAAALIFFDVHEAYERALTTEDAVLEKVLDWLMVKNDRILQLADWLGGDDCDADGEHRPLLEALARVLNNPSSVSFITQKLDDLESKPALYQKAFMRDLFAQVENSNPNDQDKAWLDFLRPLLSEAGIEITSETLLSAMSAINYERLPVSIQQRITADHKNLVKKTRERYASVLQPFVRPDRFLIFDAIGGSPNPPLSSSRKRRKGSRGRVTPKQRTTDDVVKNLEEEEHITGAFVAVNSTQGYILQSIETDKKDIAEQLLESRIAQAYLQTYQSDAKIAEDLALMLRSIVEEPRGNGSSKMQGRKLKVNLSENPKAQRHAFPVWHLSPHDRSFTKGLGTAGNKTRIYFLVIPNGDGTESIALLDIDKKNSSEQQNGNFRRTS